MSSWTRMRPKERALVFLLGAALSSLAVGQDVVIPEVPDASRSAAALEAIFEEEVHAKRYRRAERLWTFIQETYPDTPSALRLFPLKARLLRASQRAQRVQSWQYEERDAFRFAFIPAPSSGVTWVIRFSPVGGLWFIVVYDVPISCGTSGCIGQWFPAEADPPPPPRYVRFLPSDPGRATHTHIGFELSEEWLTTFKEVGAWRLKLPGETAPDDLLIAWEGLDVAQLTGSVPNP